MKQQTDADLSRIAAEEKENDYSKAANREMRLSEYHYATSVKLGEVKLKQLPV